MDVGTRNLYLRVTTDPDNHVLALRMKVVNAKYEQVGRSEILWFNLTPSLSRCVV